MNAVSAPKEEREYKATWLELFFDLVYVAIVARKAVFEFRFHFKIFKTINLVVLMLTVDQVSNFNDSTSEGTLSFFN